MGKRARGFTLIELAVVLAVVSIMLAAIAPNFIESARNKLALQTADDMATIADAARWFRVDTGAWPDQQPGLCAVDANAATFYGTLVQNNYLAMPLLAEPYPPPTNPWGGAYLASFVNALGTCVLRITNGAIPQTVQRLITNALPSAICGPPTLPLDTCYADTLPAGSEASMAGVVRGPQGPCVPPNPRVRGIDAAGNILCGP